MLAGTISWLGGCALWATSVEYVRRRFFELFYKTHILGLVTFFLFGFMHHVSLWAYTMPGAPPPVLLVIATRDDNFQGWHILWMDRQKGHCS